MAELIRRAVDAVYRRGSRRRIGGVMLSGGLWRDEDAALVGRRAWIRKPRLSDE